VRKTTKKLALSRETLHQLEMGSAGRVVGGASAACPTIIGKTCPVAECTSSCNPLCSARIDCCP
jgi:hypothetical protein